MVSMSGPRSTALVTCVLIFCFTWQHIEASGVIRLKLISYDNPIGQVFEPGQKPKCCDAPTANTRTCDAAMCDPLFDVCISSMTQRFACEYYYARTKSFPDTDSIQGFGLRPFEFSIVMWEGAIFVNITVWEEEPHGHLSLMEVLTASFTLSTPSQHGIVEWVDLELTKPGGLRIATQMSVECDDGFRDRMCLCHDVNNATQHTGCDRDGVNVCLPGWADLPQCLTPTSACANKTICLNNATCGSYIKNQVAKFICHCPMDFTGTRCETQITTTTAPTTTITTTTTPNIPSAITATTNIPSAIASTASIPLISSIPTGYTTKRTSKRTVSNTVPTTTAYGTTLTLQTTSPSTATKYAGTAPTALPSTTVAGSTTKASVFPVVVSATTAGPAPTGATPNSTGTPATGSDEGGSTGTIAGVAAGVVVLGALGVLLFLFRKKLYKLCQNEVGDTERDPVQDMEEDKEVDHPSDNAPDSGQNQSADVTAVPDDVAVGNE